jgi:hypothetical protein
VTTPERARLYEIAKDVGRLRRRTADDEYDARLVKRIAFNIVALAAMLEPPAAEIAQAIRAECFGDLELAAEEAIRIVDRRVERLRRLLAEPAPFAQLERPALRQAT